MTPEGWRQVEEVYHAALDLSADQRPAFLTQTCGSDEELLEKVAALLQAHSDAGDFLVHPAMEVAAEAAASKGRCLFDWEADQPLPDSVSTGRRRDGRGL